MRPRLIAAIVLGLTWFGSVYAQDFDKEVTGLTDKLTKALVAKGIKKIVLVDFVDLQGHATEFGRFLAEQMTVEMANAEGISVVDRANIKSILSEHKLTEEGLVNPENAKKLGQFAGVDAILIGTLTPLDSDVVLTVKAISTETAQVVAAAKVSLRTTERIQKLVAGGLSDPSSGSVAGAGDLAVNAPNSDAPAVATNDVKRPRNIEEQGDAGGQFADQVRRETDFAKASIDAGKSGLYMLLDFSGSDWCGWCVKLDNEVFSKSAFTDFAKKNLVCVLVDFPRQNEQTTKVKEQNSALARKYDIQGFPTVIILSPEGDLVGKIGYQEGGANKYVEHLKEMIGTYEKVHPKNATQGQPPSNKPDAGGGK